MVVLVVRADALNFGFPWGKKLPSVPSIFMSYFFSGNSRGCCSFLLSVGREFHDEGEGSG